MAQKTPQQYDKILAEFYKLLNKEYTNQFSKWCKENGMRTMLFVWTFAHNGIIVLAGYGAEDVDGEFTKDNDENPSDLMWLDFDEKLFEAHEEKDRARKIYKIFKHIKENNECPPRSIWAAKLKINLDIAEAKINEITDTIYKKQLTERSQKDAKDMLDYFATGCVIIHDKHIRFYIT